MQKTIRNTCFEANFCSQDGAHGPKPHSVSLSSQNSQTATVKHWDFSFCPVRAAFSSGRPPTTVLLLPFVDLLLLLNFPVCDSVHILCTPREIRSSETWFHFANWRSDLRSKKKICNVKVSASCSLFFLISCGNYIVTLSICVEVYKHMNVIIAHLKKISLSNAATTYVYRTAIFPRNIVYRICNTRQIIPLRYNL